ncbi:MAG TPA: hypothetical protein VHC22_09325 [Pirellulales bacterium]|nr:hypothetical protein [Pirellulales bacterium]
MRHLAWHGCRAVFVLLVMLVVTTARESLGQSDVNDDTEKSENVDSSRAPRHYRPCEVVKESIFGAGDDEPFTPLLLRTLFTDGWDDPWIAPPSDSDMPVRQGWVNAPDGLFFRNLVWTYQNTADIPGDRSANLGLFQFQSPLSRRLWMTLDVPYVTTLSAPNAASFGDLNLGTRVMLRETRRLSIIAGLGTRMPTGQLSTGTGLMRLNPNLQFWAHLSGRWSMRGGAGVDVPLNNFDLLPTNFLTNVAIGETITGHDVPIFGDFQYYMTATLRNNLSSNVSVPTFFSLTPGFRTHLGGEYYLAGGIEFPLTQPHPYGDRLTFFLVKGF